MANGNTTIRELQKKHYTKENLDQFIRYMKNEESRMALLQMALEYPVFYETVSELEADENCPACLRTQAQKVVSLIQTQILSDAERSVDALQQIDALRQELTTEMKILSGYTDCMVLYEYILNRKEYDFREDSHVEKLSDQALKDRIMAYLTSDNDNQAAQLRTLEVIAQLPMRMTKQRFFQIIEDSFSIYIGSEKSTVEELAYMLRSAAGLVDVDTQGLFPDLAEVKASVGNGVVQELDSDRFEAIYVTLEQAMDRLNAYMDCVTCIQEIVNSVYVILLCGQFGLAQVTEQEHCLEILRRINNLFANENRPEIGDSLDELFVSIEGIQERLQEQLEQAEAVFGELPKEQEDIAISEGLRQLSWCIRLQSSSLFADLEPAVSEEADEVYVRQLSAALCQEYRERFHGQPKMLVRGIMANALTMLPLFVRNYEEIENYVETSLRNCTDAAEKTACTELLLQLMQKTVL
ncbi:MAG: hypothetical protein IJV50_03545 [Lachnospiraceae bacterium]|nr:hypothetical protein [Lachnospiraceae bacterium]